MMTKPHHECIIINIITLCRRVRNYLERVLIHRCSAVAGRGFGENGLQSNHVRFTRTRDKKKQNVE